MRADKEGWDFPEKTVTLKGIDPEIKLSDLGTEIRDSFAIPEGRKHAFYMENDSRKPAYTDLEDQDRAGTMDAGDSREHTLAETMKSKKFKYEYSFSDGLMFQCEVL